MPCAVGSKEFRLFNKNCRLSYALVVPMFTLVVVVTALSVAWKDIALLRFMIWYSVSVGLALLYRLDKLHVLSMPTAPFEPRWLWKWLPLPTLLAPIIPLHMFVDEAPQIGFLIVSLMLVYLYLTLVALLTLSAKLRQWAGAQSEKRVKQEIKKILFFQPFFFVFPLVMLLIM